MKKLFALLAVLLIAQSVNAAADIKIYSGAPLSATTTVYAQAYASTLGNTSLQVTKDCGSAVEQAHKNQRALYLVSNFQIADAARSNQRCDLDINTKNVLSISSIYFKYCRLPLSKKTLTTPNVTIGRASMHPISAFTKDFNSNNNASVTVIPYKGSKDIVTAVLNGDIDYGLISLDVADPIEQQGKVVCDYDTTEKGSATRKSLNDHFNLKLNGFALKFILVAVGDFTPSDLKQYKDAFNSSEFQQYLKNNYYFDIVKSVTDSDIKLLNRNITDLTKY